MRAAGLTPSLSCREDLPHANMMPIGRASYMLDATTDRYCPRHWQAPATADVKFGESSNPVDFIDCLTSEALQQEEALPGDTRRRST